jgi:hypothetical protein
MQNSPARALSKAHRKTNKNKSALASKRVREAGVCVVLNSGQTHFVCAARAGSLFKILRLYVARRRSVTCALAVFLSFFSRFVSSNRRRITRVNKILEALRAAVFSLDVLVM